MANTKVSLIWLLMGLLCVQANLGVNVNLVNPYFTAAKYTKNLTSKRAWDYLTLKTRAAIYTLSHDFSLRRISEFKPQRVDDQSELVDKSFDKFKNDTVLCHNIAFHRNNSASFFCLYEGAISHYENGQKMAYPMFWDLINIFVPGRITTFAAKEGDRKGSIELAFMSSSGLVAYIDYYRPDLRSYDMEQAQIGALYISRTFGVKYPNSSSSILSARPDVREKLLVNYNRRINATSIDAISVSLDSSGHTRTCYSSSITKSDKLLSCWDISSTETRKLLQINAFFTSPRDNLNHTFIHYTLLGGNLQRYSSYCDRENFYPQVVHGHENQNNCSRYQIDEISNDIAGIRQGICDVIIAFYIDKYKLVPFAANATFEGVDKKPVIDLNFYINAATAYAGHFYFFTHANNLIKVDTVMDDQCKSVRFLWDTLVDMPGDRWIMGLQKVPVDDMGPSVVDYREIAEGSNDTNPSVDLQTWIYEKDWGLNIMWVVVVVLVATIMSALLISLCMCCCRRCCKKSSVNRAPSFESLDDYDSYPVLPKKSDKRGGLISEYMRPPSLSPNKRSKRKTKSQSKKLLKSMKSTKSSKISARSLPNHTSRAKTKRSKFSKSGKSSMVSRSKTRDSEGGKSHV